MTTGTSLPAAASNHALTRQSGEFSDSISSHLLEVGRPESVAVLDDGRGYSYAELRRAVQTMAALFAGIGLAPGDRVGILAGNSFFWVAAYLAAMTRYVAVPLSDRLTPADVRRQTGFASCRVVAIDQRHRAAYASALAGIPTLTEADLAAGDPPTAPDPVPIDPDADAALMFTSGTTARPKAVRVTHRNLRANTASILGYLDLDPTDRMLVVLPFSYCFGASLLHTHLRAGGSLSLCNTFAYPQTAVNLLERDACTGFAGVPSSYQLMLRASSLAGHRLPSLRRLLQAGGRLPTTLVDELRAAQPGAQLFVMYGQTEATARLSYLPPEFLDSKAGSVGRAVPGGSLEVLGEDGEPTATGQVGEIVAAGENISPGYLADPEATAAKFPGGRLRTGDLAYLDEDGFIFVVDRREDFIKSWGHRVSSQEIEAAALRLPGLVMASAVGVPDPQAGEAIELFAVARPGAGLGEAEVLSFLRGELARQLLPRHVHLVAELPLNPSGKVLKAQLRQLAAELHAAPAGPAS